MHDPWTAIDAYQRGELGASVRRVELTWRTPERAHAKLIAAGFWPRRFGIADATNRSGQRRWRLAPFGSVDAGHDDPLLAAEHVYVHADGGVVRLFTGACAIGSFEVTDEAWARKSVLFDPPASRGNAKVSLDDEAFAVTDDGVPLPKSPRADHGVKYDAAMRLESHRLARAAIVGARLPLAASAFPKTPLAPRGRGLAKGLTIVPAGNFWSVADELAKRASTQPVLMREEGGDLRLFFAGDLALALALHDEIPRTGLASLTIRRGTNVLAIDPTGYDGSVEHLARFVAPILTTQKVVSRRSDPFLRPEARPTVRVYEDATGRDLSFIAARRPRQLFVPDAVPDLAIEAA